MSVGSFNKCYLLTIHLKIICINMSDLVGWVYGISTFVGYLMPNPFYENSQFYFYQFSLE